MTADCPACLNGCGGARSDCPKRVGGTEVSAREQAHETKETKKSQIKPTKKPTKLTQAVATEFLRRLANGRSMRDICINDADMPPRHAVWDWLESNESFRDQYARAREKQAHAIADDAIDGAINATDAQLARLAFDARRWFAGKVAPKVYGDKVLPAESESEKAITIRVVGGLPTPDENSGNA